MIANARMYSVNAAAGAAWRNLLAWVTQRAGLPWEIIDYAAPAPLAKLWARDDLGCALMCGLPYTLRAPTPQLIAAPVPSPLRYGGRARYMTDLAVRADSPYRRFEETFGGRLGYTDADSQSGYFALRSFLRPFQQQHGGALFGTVTGDLLNARGVIDALAAGRIDVGPLDSYSHDLLLHLEPGYAQQVRTIACTEATPIPPFVATARLDPGTLANLQQSFAEAESASELTEVRACLLLTGFEFPSAADYAPLRRRHDALIARPEVW
jgi:ABC-type phosphate/phosphonate transport system substrate-binding protein